MPKALTDPTDFLGRKFGKLTPTSFLRTEPHPTSKRFVYFYECRCECGSTVEVTRRNLRTKTTTSCGCAHRAAKSGNPNWKGYEEISGSFWCQVRWKAVSRGLPLTLTIEEAWELFLRQGRRCALTGVPLVLASRNGDTTASLDRIDSTKGYTPDNVQWLHKDVNLMKREFTTPRFIELCKAIVAHTQRDQ